MARTIGTIVGGGLRTACITVGPDYEPPEVVVADEWHEALVDNMDASAAAVDWWSSLNDSKQIAVIWLVVPLAMIGVTVGLLATGQPFGFMATLGLLSLIGMLIKNAIVLVDQIDIELAEGKNGWDAILDSAVSRLRPVVIALVSIVAVKLAYLLLKNDASGK